MCLTLSSLFRAFNLKDSNSLWASAVPLQKSSNAGPSRKGPSLHRFMYASRFDMSDIVRGAPKTSNFQLARTFSTTHGPSTSQAPLSGAPSTPARRCNLKGGYGSNLIGNPVTAQTSGTSVHHLAADLPPPLGPAPYLELVPDPALAPKLVDAGLPLLL